VTRGRRISASSLVRVLPIEGRRDLRSANTPHSVRPRHACPSPAWIRGGKGGGLPLGRGAQDAPASARTGPRARTRRTGRRARTGKARTGQTGCAEGSREVPPQMDVWWIRRGGRGQRERCWRGSTRLVRAHPQAWMAAGRIDGGRDVALELRHAPQRRVQGRRGSVPARWPSETEPIAETRARHPPASSCPAVAGRRAGPGRRRDMHPAS